MNYDELQKPIPLTIIWWEDAPMAKFEHVGDVKQCRCGGAQIWVSAAHVAANAPVYCGEPRCEIPKRVAYSEEIRKGHMIVLTLDLDRPSVTPKDQVLLKG